MHESVGSVMKTSRWLRDTPQCHNTQCNLARILHVLHEFIFERCYIYIDLTNNVKQIVQYVALSLLRPGDRGRSGRMYFSRFRAFACCVRQYSLHCLSHLAFLNNTHYSYRDSRAFAGWSWILLKFHPITQELSVVIDSQTVESMQGVSRDIPRKFKVTRCRTSMSFSELMGASAVNAFCRLRASEKSIRLKFYSIFTVYSLHLIRLRIVCRNSQVLRRFFGSICFRCTFTASFLSLSRHNRRVWLTYSSLLEV